MYCWSSDGPIGSYAGESDQYELKATEALVGSVTRVLMIQFQRFYDFLKA